jgi:hypothetical protein
MLYEKTNQTNKAAIAPRVIPGSHQGITALGLTLPSFKKIYPGLTAKSKVVVATVIVIKRTPGSESPMFAKIVSSRVRGSPSIVKASMFRVE